MIASWGPKTFEASSKKIYTFNDFSNSAALNMESQENEGAKAFTAIRGIETEKIGFKMKLNREYADVLSDIQGWKNLMAGKKPYPLYIGSKKFGSLPWLLVSVDVSETEIGPHGAVISAVVDLRFEEINKLKPPSKASAESSDAGGSGSASSSRTATGSSGAASVSGSKQTVTQNDDALKKAAASAINAVIAEYSSLQGDIYKTVRRRLKELADYIINQKSWTWKQAREQLISTLSKMSAEYLLSAPFIIPGIQKLLDKAKGTSSGVVTTTGGPTANDFVDFARKQLGKPYVLGAKGPDKFDCSGLVYYCLKTIGVNIGYMTSAGWASGPYPRIGTITGLKYGDIVCFKGHVGIFLGQVLGNMIDASSSEGKVRCSSTLASVPYWRDNFICGRRVFL